MIKNFLNPEGHQNPISGSKVTAILLKGWMLPIGGAASGRVCACPTQQACSHMSVVIEEEDTCLLVWTLNWLEAGAQRQI